MFDWLKKSKGEQIRENADQGKSGEEKIRRDYELAGYKVERTGRGHDWKASKRDWFTGKKETKYIEVKTGSSELSPLQKKKKRPTKGSIRQAFPSKDLTSSFPGPSA